MYYKPVAYNHRMKINKKVTQVKNFEVSVPTHVALRMFILQVLASQSCIFWHRIENKQKGHSSRNL